MGSSEQLHNPGEKGVFWDTGGYGPPRSLRPLNDQQGAMTMRSLNHSYRFTRTGTPIQVNERWLMGFAHSNNYISMELGSQVNLCHSKCQNVVGTTTTVNWAFSWECGL